MDGEKEKLSRTQKEFVGDVFKVIPIIFLFGMLWVVTFLFLFGFILYISVTSKKVPPLLILTFSLLVSPIAFLLLTWPIRKLYRKHVGSENLMEILGRNNSSKGK